MAIAANTISSFVLKLMCTSCVLGLANAATAQEPVNDAGTGLQDIVVTAQKRSQSAQDVGITMSVVTSDVLQRQNVQEVADVARAIPNIQINYGLGQNAFNIRGIGINEFASNLDSPVATHVDEVYLSKNFMSNLLLFDVDRVEALKGPQGTLFGRNTTGGSMNFYTRKPTNTFTVGGTLGYDDYETIRADGYVSGPLSDSLSARLSGMYVDQNQGFYHNITTGRDEGYEKKWALRGQLLWKGADTSFLLSATYGKDHSNLPPYYSPGVFTPASVAANSPALCANYLNGTVTGADASCVRYDGHYPGSNDPYTSHGNLTHQAHSKGYGVTGRLEHDLGWATLTSISSYQYYLRDSAEDSDSDPGPSIETYYRNKIKQLTQEVRITSKGNDAWDYVLGAFYEHDKFQNNDYLTIAGGAGVGLYSPFGQSLDAVALFFHNEVKVTPTLSLVAGARYSYEKLHLTGGTYAGTGLSTGEDQHPTTIIAPLSLASLAQGGGRRSDENVSFKMGVQWKPEINSAFVDKLMVYGNVSTGFRSGAFNAEYANPQLSLTSLNPETLTAYEAGFKSTLAGRRLQLNGAVFRYDFKDGFINVDSASSPIPITINAANIRTYGAEFDARLLVTEGLELSGSLGWLDPEIKSDITVKGSSLRGNRPVNSPRWTFAGGIDFNRPLSETLKLNMSLNANYRTAQYMEAVNAPSNLEPGYWLVNARIGIGNIDDRWALSAWVKNLTKSQYRIYVNDLPDFGWVLNAYGPPRVFGATLGFKF
ncbi:MAG: TonB-dependent receptor [Sphingomonadaceae bacterium]